MNPVTVLWLIAACLMLQPLSTDLYLASLPHLASDFGMSPGAAQQTLTLFVAGFGCAQLISGPLSDRFGRRPVLLAGLGVYGIASIGCALAPTLAALVALRFVQAIGCCTAVVVARAVIRDLYAPTEGARVMARASSLMAMAPILGPILGSYLQVRFGWRAAFVVHTLFAGTLTVAAYRHFRETHLEPDRFALQPAAMRRAYRQIAGNARFWAWALPGALSYASIFAFIAGSSFVLIDVLGVATEHYGYGFAFGVTGYLTGTLICRRLLGRIGLERSLLMGASCSLGASLLFFSLILAGWHHWVVVVSGLFLVMLAHGINFPCSQTGAVSPFPRQAGAAAGLLGFLTMLAGFVTGSWIGFSGDGTVQPLASVSVSIGVLLFVSTWGLRRQRVASQHETV